MPGTPRPDRPATRHPQPTFPLGRLLAYLTLVALLLDHWLSPDTLRLLGVAS
jgi:hypothetical protein